MFLQRLHDHILKVKTNSCYWVSVSASVTMATAIYYTPLCFKFREVTLLNINVQRYSEGQSINNSITLKCTLLMCCKTLNITSRSCHGDLNIENGDQQDYENSNFECVHVFHAWWRCRMASSCGSLMSSTRPYSVDPIMWSHHVLCGGSRTVFILIEEEACEENMHVWGHHTHQHMLNVTMETSIFLQGLESLSLFLLAFSKRTPTLTRWFINKHTV